MKIQAVLQVSQDEKNWTIFAYEGNVHRTDLLREYAFVRVRLIYMPESDEDEVFVIAPSNPNSKR